MPKLLVDDVAQVLLTEVPAGFLLRPTQVHEHAQVAFPEVAKVLNTSDLEKHIVPIIRDLAAAKEEVL